jgi:hypothetical protein
LVNSQFGDKAMAEKDVDKANGKPSASPDGGPKGTQAKSELPTVESPPLSPAAPEPAFLRCAEPIMIDPIEDAPARAPAIEIPAAPASAPAVEAARASRPRLAFKARHRRNALLVASVAIAAALGAIVGAVASGGFASPARTDVAGLEERKAMQQSITHLAKEITTLKASIAVTNKSAHSQIAKLDDKLSERLKRESAEITGSISVPQTTAPSPASPMATPVPTPRPAPRIAAAESQPSARPLVLQGWSIRGVRDGYVYVQGHGDVYQVVRGAPLPGLGPVQSIRRQDGRWVVVTPKGLIVSRRDRRFFESF